MPGLFDEPRLPAEDAGLRPNAPLADRMRPRTLDEFMGQEHILARNSMLRKAIESDRLVSMIFWGPPGTGKTSLAEIIARMTGSRFISISAVMAGVSDIRKAVQTARREKTAHRRTILFVDEIHRFNKGQQDALLGSVEDGTVLLVGATTENPSFEVNNALLSRVKVYMLKPLGEEHLRRIMQNAVRDRNRGLGTLDLVMAEDAADHMIALSGGDARMCLNWIEFAAMGLKEDDKGKKTITRAMALEVTQQRVARHDRDGEEHYNLISAFHKSMRNSNPDATLYWLGRMLNGGDDPLYIARRIVRCATEDVGLAAPQALNLALSAVRAVHFIGMPEGDLALAQAAVYCAMSPKSNALYMALNNVKSTIEKTGQLPVPMHLRNAPTRMMKDFGYGKGYRYAHDDPDGLVDSNDLPEDLGEMKFYQPTGRGFEGTLGERLQKWAETRMKKQEKS